MSRIIAVIALVAVLAVGGGLIAATAYQAGLSTTVATAAADGATVVVPTTGYGWGYGMGYGWHPAGFGFGFFGFLGTLLFIFLVIALVRAIFFRGGPGRHGGWGPGWGGRPGRWESRFGEGFDDWHRRAHDHESSGEPPASNTGSKPA
jgi:hypothetical protein